MTKRQEIEAKLPPAPKTMLAYVYNRCIEAGIAPNKEDFIFIHRAMVEYLSTSREGTQVMLKLLNADVVQASYTKQYFPEGFFGDATRKLDYRALSEFRGYVYNGKSYPWKTVDVSERPDMDSCDQCNGRFPKNYCATVVKEMKAGTEVLQTLCNHCKLHNSDTRIRDQASQKTCHDCAITACQFKPNKAVAAKPALLEHKPVTQQMPQWADPRYGAIQ